VGGKKFARVVKKHFPEKLSKRSDYEKFLLDSIFPTKLTEFVPFIFIISQYCPTVKRILPDWLCLPNKLGGCRPPRPPPARYAHEDVETDKDHSNTAGGCFPE
jgi:hypothetical protein